MTKAEFLTQKLDDTDTVTVSAKEYRHLLLEESTNSALAEKLSETQKTLSSSIEENVILAKKILKLEAKMPTYTIDMIA